MGDIVVSEFVSLDGVFEDPGGAEGFRQGGWAFGTDHGEDGNAFKLNELQEAEAQLLGRVTYEGFAAAWPAMEESAGAFGRKMNAMPKYIVSSTLTSAEWQNSTILDGSVADDVERLKREIVGPILVAGSGTLVRGLLGLGLVDELRLMVFPVVLGEGRRLLGDAAGPVPLTLTECVAVGDGIALLTYRRV